MNRAKLAGMTGVALLLSACGGGNQEPAPGEDASTPSPAESAASAEQPIAEETPVTEAPPAPEATPAMPVVAEVAALAAEAPAAFNQCKACHAVDAGKNGIGPSLAGVFGAKAGDVGDFAYSDAMRGSGMTWNAASLDAYLTNPSEAIPGNKMSFAGLKDEAKRQAVIAYLKGL